MREAMEPLPGGQGLSSSIRIECPRSHPGRIGWAGRSVSRVLYPGSLPGDGHSSGTRVAPCLARPTRAAGPEADPDAEASSPLLFGLAPGGVCRATPVAGGAVRSYRTLSPLPAGPEGPGGRSALCGTFPGVAPAGRYPAPCFRGARTFLPRPLAGAAIRPPGPSCIWQGLPGLARPATPFYAGWERMDLAGAAGFEPANAGTKIRCLTTWRRPSRQGQHIRGRARFQRIPSRCDWGEGWGWCPGEDSNLHGLAATTT